ncbi:hypothetical protein HALLA_17330 [Halostagnicola larsenii XH-48]|uniref:DUF2085 domain-containing protein n=1 Tax=Halostagnicola larsenii XH-48 TaxID=797299 RepID=W0JSX5_9EURY|nr:DUF2085 domain-containing protein [Halostagnicola larsenii]AHG00300.1 hypothetical protein HALLA_17330 [Halostagnicola larsenii XH-48]
MGIDRSELRAGLARTWPYLLSHHLPSERHRCYAPVIFGRRIHICARCLGIYPGILAALVVALLGGGLLASPVATLAVALVFPLPALVDWTLTTFTERRGYNLVRTATGFLLGCGYGTGLVHLLLAGDLRVLAVGIAYALAAGSLLYLSTIDGETER